MGGKVFVSGCYDMLHSGHVRFFEEASRLGDFYVGIGNDANILALKNRPTANGEQERLYMVKAVRYVKDAWINSGMGKMGFGDVAEVMCNSSFDWNGKKMPQVLATENDSLNGICMLLIWLLTNKASMFADVRTYWSDAAVKRATGKGLPKDAKNGIIHLLNSGSCCLDAAGEMKEKGKSVFKNWWDVTEKDIDATLKATKWVSAGVEYFRGGGFSSSFLTPKGMPLTMIRISIVKGQGPVMQIASMLRIPVAMHNVPEEKVFQPHCWGRFGASEDPTGADYRACKNFGPLYATNRCD